MASASSPARPASIQHTREFEATQRSVRNLVFRWADPLKPFPVYKVVKGAPYIPRAPLGSLVQALVAQRRWDAPALTYLPPEPLKAPPPPPPKPAPAAKPAAPAAGAPAAAAPAAAKPAAAAPAAAPAAASGGSHRRSCRRSRRRSGPEAGRAQALTESPACEPRRSSSPGHSEAPRSSAPSAVLSARLSPALAAGASRPLAGTFTLADGIFYAVAALTVAGAAAVALSRNILYSALGLLASLLGAAGLYVFLSADFVAVAQVFIYIGGVLVLILFAVMLTNRIGEVNISNASMGWVSGGILSAVMLGLLLVVAFEVPWAVRSTGGAPDHRPHRPRACSSSGCSPSSSPPSSCSPP